MRARIEPGGTVRGDVHVPGDKSIAHRWLILAATASGSSRIVGLPTSLDVRSTAACLALLVPGARPSLEAWLVDARSGDQHHGFTWDTDTGGDDRSALEVEAEGRGGLRAPGSDLDCGNSGTTMRLLAGVVAGAPFRTVLRGDASLTRRPMERVAEPLRRMGAVAETDDGRPPLVIQGGALRGIRCEMPVPSAQVKSCVLLAGLAASGETIVEEAARTRDHTERALLALGAPIAIGERDVEVSAFQHQGFEGKIPGDVSSAAFLAAAAVLTGGSLTIRGVGLNPTRLGFLGVMARMGIRTEQEVLEERLGEPVGDLSVGPGAGLTGTGVGEGELPLVIDEVPVLAALAAHADGETRFAGAQELREKESDRLRGLAEQIQGLGGLARVEGEDLVVAGGGLAGGNADALGDHRMAMAMTVAALGARGPSEVGGMESAVVSYPGFVEVLAGLGARFGG